MFFTLSTTRALGMGGVGPIPWTAINDYALRHEIAGDDFDELVTLMQTMDRVYLAHANRSPGTTSDTAANAPADT